MLTRGYILCGYARTGSTLLCRALHATGRFGYAQEYFNPVAVDAIDSTAYPTDPAAQLLEIERRGASPDGIYGVKMFADQFDALAGFDWIGALPCPSFIHLERQDALGQALSNVRAVQTGQWTGEQAARRQPQYDERAITAELVRSARYRARWQLFFARNGIQPLWLTYEAMIADLPGTVHRVAAHVGVGDLPATLPDLVTLPPQADAVSDEWRDRFIASQGDRSLLDALPADPGTTSRQSTGTGRTARLSRWLHRR